MICPKCGAPDVPGDECPSCHVFISKYLAAQEKKRAADEAAEKARAEEEERARIEAGQKAAQKAAKLAAYRAPASTTKTCKYCYSEIDRRASICPHCQKPQATQYSLMGCLVVVLVGGFVISLISSTVNRATSPAAQSIPVPVQKPSTPERIVDNVPDGRDVVMGTSYSYKKKDESTLLIMFDSPLVNETDGDNYHNMAVILMLLNRYYSKDASSISVASHPMPDGSGIYFESRESRYYVVLFKDKGRIAMLGLSRKPR